MVINVLDFCTVSDNDIVLTEIEKLGNVRYYPTLTEDEIIKNCSDSEILLINKAVISAHVIENMPNLKYIGTFSTGYNVIDLDCCKKHGIRVCNVPDYSTYAVSQHVFALILNYSNSLSLYEQSVKRGDWQRAKAFTYFAYPAEELYCKTLGIVGYGNIGKQVAKIAESFGMKVIVTPHDLTKPCDREKVELSNLLSRSDYVSLHCPLTEETKLLINEKTISQMKNNSVLVNTARGGLVDEYALRNALLSGKIRAALLDTVSIEPIQENNPLLGLENCFITPHVAWIPLETRQRLVKVVTQNLLSFLEGKGQNIIV